MFWTSPRGFLTKPSFSMSGVLLYWMTTEAPFYFLGQTLNISPADSSHTSTFPIFRVSCSHRLMNDLLLLRSTKCLARSSHFHFHEKDAGVEARTLHALPFPVCFFSCLKIFWRLSSKKNTHHVFFFTSPCTATCT